MNILCLNTAFLQADLAVKLDEFENYKKFDSTCKHSEHVMLGIDEMLNGTKVKNLDYMAVCIGTGSFTGIRIGISIAEGFKTANKNLKLIPINSFELVKSDMQKINNDEFAIVLNALGGRYFVQYYKNKVETCQPLLLQKEQIKNVHKIGLVEEKLEFCDEFVTFSPQNLLSLALEKVEKNQVVENLEPLYIRQSQAEENLNKKENNENN